MPKTYLTEEEKKEWEHWGREKALNIQILNKNPDECRLFHNNLEPAKTEAWEAWNKGYNTNNIKLSEEAETPPTPPFKKFYLVWKDEKGSLSPTVKHFSEEKARAEAIRLAKEFRNNTIYVVEAISKFQVKSEVIETKSE